MPPAVEARSPNPWTTREFPPFLKFIKIGRFIIHPSIRHLACATMCQTLARRWDFALSLGIPASRSFLVIGCSSGQWRKSSPLFDITPAASASCSFLSSVCRRRCELTDSLVKLRPGPHPLILSDSEEWRENMPQHLHPLCRTLLWIFLPVHLPDADPDPQVPPHTYSSSTVGVTSSPSYSGL